MIGAPHTQDSGPSRNAGAPPARPSRWARLWHLVDPVALILLLAACFDWISGNPVHGLFLGSVGAILARTTYVSRRDASEERSTGEAPDVSGSPEPLEPWTPGTGKGSFIPGGRTIPVLSGDAVVLKARAPSRSESTRNRYHTMLLVAVAFLYALLVAAFPRYSWPSTIGVAVLAVAAIVRGWNEQEPREDTPIIAYKRWGFAAWSAVFATGALWELSALLQQPDLITGSDAHPTVSVLSDALLATYLGRCVMLLAWLGFGWYLVRLVKR